MSGDSADAGYGYLDYAADMEEYGGQVLGQFDRLNELSSRLAQNVRGLLPAINKARTAKSALEERALMNDLATLMTEYVRDLSEGVLPKFHEGWERVGHAMHWMASQKPGDVDASRIAELCATGQGLRDALKGIVSNVASVRDIVSTGRGRTGALDRSIVTMEHVFNSIVSEVMIADATLVAVYIRLGCPDPPSG